MRFVLPIGFLALVGMACLPAHAQQAAQTPQRIEARVTYIAGQSAYIDAGRAASLATGDTLRTFRADELLGLLVVLSATEERAVVTFADTPFALTLGDVLLLERSAAVSAPEATPAEPEPIAERPSLLTPTESAAPSYARTPSVSGRFQVGLDGLTSSTRATADGPRLDRTFVQPFATLRAGVDGLPGGLRLDAHLRAAYRASDPIPLDRPADVRVYQLGLEKSFDEVPLTIYAGRFYNRYDRFSGYWDGLSFHVGDDDRGVGVTAGFQPDRADEAPSGDLPKYTVFGHAAFNVEGARVDGTLLAGQVLPRGEGMQARTFVGARQTAYARGFALSTEALIDQDPETGDWTFSRLGGRLNVTAAPGVRLRAYALSRRSYLLFGERQALLDRSTRVGGGATLTVRSGPLPGTSLRADLSTAATEGQPRTLTTSGGLSIPRLPGTALGVSADATVWAQDTATGTRRGVYGGAGLTRSFGTVYARLGYRYHRSPLLPDEALITHGLDALVQVPLTPRLAFTLQAITQFGDRLASNRLYTALWYRL